MSAVAELATDTVTITLDATLIEQVAAWTVEGLRGLERPAHQLDGLLARDDDRPREIPSELQEARTDDAEVVMERTAMSAAATRASAPRLASTWEIRLSSASARTGRPVSSARSAATSPDSFSTALCRSA